MLGVEKREKDRGGALVLAALLCWLFWWKEKRGEMAERD